MLESFPVILIIGTALGFLTGLGVGGGSLLIIWLTAVLGMDPAMARGINLLFFLPGAAIAICLRRKQGAIQWKNVLPCAAAGCIAAGIFSYLSTVLDVVLLKKLFGGILIAAGIRELLWKSKT
ncbi:MAG: TSUP family transporter [Oscillospiraceae bacterium]|nr:TSUP family transporter [Oscillospiraceae bacterium]